MSMWMILRIAPAPSGERAEKEASCPETMDERRSESTQGAFEGEDSMTLPERIAIDQELD
jgi:hypothetical protein